MIWLNFLFKFDAHVKYISLDLLNLLFEEQIVQARVSGRLFQPILQIFLLYKHFLGIFVHHFLDALNRALPLIIHSSLITNLRLRNIEESIFVLLANLFANDGNQFTHELQLRLGGVDQSVFNHVLKGVPHDTNQHVEHCNLDYESWQNEEHIAKIGLRSLSKGI